MHGRDTPCPRCCGTGACDRLQTRTSAPEDRMWFTMQPRDLGWPATASRRLLSEAVLEATPEEVWALWADIDAWPRWFPDIRSGSWDTEPPHGVGSRRTMVLNTLTVREHLLAWEPGSLGAWSAVRVHPDRRDAPLRDIHRRGLPTRGAAGRHHALHVGDHLRASGTRPPPRRRVPDDLRTHDRAGDRDPADLRQGASDRKLTTPRAVGCGTRLRQAQRGQIR